MGYASNYFTIRALDSNSVCYTRVDSSYCFNGYKPIYFARLFNMYDTIKEQFLFSANEMIIDKELWFKGDTCSFWHENAGAKFIAVKLDSHGMKGLSWINLELYPKNYNGFSADVKETGFKSRVSSIWENVSPGIVIYPNPSDGYVNIVIPELIANVSAVICDLSGNEIASIDLNRKNSRIRLAKGTYLLKISLNKKAALVKKVFVL